MGECIYISIDIGANPTQAVTHTHTHTGAEQEVHSKRKRQTVEFQTVAKRRKCSNQTTRLHSGRMQCNMQAKIIIDSSVCACG